MLLERDGQLAVLATRLEEASRGEGSLVLVAGEAGAGKTTLLRAFVESLDRTSLVIWGACDPLATPRPLGPLHDFASDPDGGLEDLDFDRSDPFQLFETVLDRLRHSIRPIVMIVEDLHWADEGTLDFLRFVGRRVADTRAMVVGTYRDDEVGSDHPLRSVLGQLTHLPSTHRLLVPALGIDSIERLSEGKAVDPEALLALTGGNPFFVTEVLAAGYVVPDTVQQAVLARVSLLDALPRRVVEAVSIAPRSLDIEHAIALVEGTVEQVDDALSAGVLLEDGRSLRFRHELARSAVEDSLPPARRLALHKRMLALLDQDPRPDLARLAHHAVQAGESDLITRHAPLAAKEASRRGAHREAISFLEAAIDQLDSVGEVTNAMNLRVDLAVEYRIVDGTRRAVPALEMAAEHGRVTGDNALLGRALIELSRTRWRLNDPGRGTRALEEALSLPTADESAPIRAEAHYQKAYLHMLGRRGTEGRNSLDEARAAAGSDVEPDLAWRIDMLDGTLDIVMGDALSGIGKLRASYESARSQGHHTHMADALSMLGSGGGEVRQYADAKAALEDSITHGLAHDEDYSVAYSRAWLARIAHEEGRWDEAVRQAELVAATVSEESGIAYVTAMSALGRVRIRRGDPGGLPLLEGLIAQKDEYELQHIWNALCGRAEHFWLREQPEAGLDELVPAFERALETESEWARGEIGYWMWKIGALDQPPKRAAEPYLLQMDGRWSEAAQLWSEIGCPYERALSLGEGGRPEALLEALAIFDSLGARPAADRVRAELRRLGVESIPRGPARSTRSNPFGLTNRQLEVLDLMRRGLTNSQIADRLFISPKTVEHHVSAILAKSGAANRSEAVAAVPDQK